MWQVLKNVFHGCSPSNPTHSEVILKRRMGKKIVINILCLTKGAKKKCKIDVLGNKINLLFSLTQYALQCVGL